MRRRRADRTAEFNVWPAFTDVLGGLVVVLVFFITIFVIGEVLIGREFNSKDNAIGQLSQLVELLEGLVGDSEAENSRLNKRIALLKSTINDNRSELDRAQGQLADERMARADFASQLEQTHDRLATEQAARAGSESELEQTRGALVRERASTEASMAEVAQLTRHTEALRQELARLNAALVVSESALNNSTQQVVEARTQAAEAGDNVISLRSQLAERDAAIAVQFHKLSEQGNRIEQMDKLIKAKLLDRVEELEQYTSDFFGRLRNVFADNPDIKIVGDRFVFQSEVLFGSGQSEVSAEGKRDLNKFVHVFRQLQEKIPKDLPVIIEVQGHTDKVPIRNTLYKSNWELSAYRALDVVNYLISQGIPPKRLAAVGMGENHPINRSGGRDALKRNRRIELKITSR